MLDSESGNITLNPTNEPPHETLESVQETEQASKGMTFMRGINIGNALDAPSSENWGVTIKEEYFQVISNAGFNAVRIPVRFSDYTGPAPDYLIQETFFSTVDEVIHWGLRNGLVVILDLHHFDAFKQDPEGEHDRFLVIWEQLATHYKDMPSELYFELLSEPSTNVTPTLWNDIVKESITIIRKSNPYRKIVIDGINYSDVDSLYQLALPTDDNLIATFHFYEPFKFTHQGAHWVSGSSDWLGTTWENTTVEKEAITKVLDQAAEWSNLYEIPVIVGEFGVTREADPTSRKDWIQFLAQEAESRGISWFLWQFCSEFGIYDCQTEVWDESILNVLINPE